MRKTRGARLLMAAMLAGSFPCFASEVDVNGTWYNFWNATANDVFATEGSSCSTLGPDCLETYADPGVPPWTFDVTGGGADFIITDGGHQGDIFSVYNTGVNTLNLIGTTSTVSVNENHVCGDFPTACLNDPLMSHGTFYLTPGAYSVSIREDQFFEPSYLAWFKIDPVTGPPSGDQPTPAAVPEPATFALAGLGLLLVGSLGRKFKLSGK